MIINDTFFEILEEQNILKTTKTKPIVDAIKNRNKISFYYSGPRTPKKDSVKSGYRVKAEAVALGLSKKGNLIVRAYVQPPSTTKTGFGKGGWRTFIVGRMSNVEITDETFDSKRPNYKEGDDNSMTVTYVTADWTKQPKDVKPEPKPQPTQEPTIQTPKEPEIKPTEPKPEVTTTEPKPEELPQPKPETKPESAPQDNVDQNVIDKQKELYNKKKSEWIGKQKEIGGNIKPGQGTRERFKKEVEKELPQPKPEEKPSPTPEMDDENKKLQESIKKIKSLMFS
jgi:hypothetical protein